MIGVWFWRKYCARPLHLFGGMGFVVLNIGALMILVLFVLRLFGYISLAGSIWPLVGFTMILAGIQLLISGLLADVVLKNYYYMRKTHGYSIKETLETNELEHSSTRAVSRETIEV